LNGSYPQYRLSAYIVPGRNIGMDPNWEERLRNLLDAAVMQFGPRCLWNIRPEPTPASLRVVARQLKTYGNLAAWRLGAEIEAELARAS